MIGRIARAGLAATLLTALVAFVPPEPRPARLVLQPGSRLTIEGTSNLHAWSCAASAIVADIRTQMNEAGTTEAVDFVSIEIPVARIECKNDKMNENLVKALRAESNPRIAFRTTGPRNLPVPDPLGRVSASFRGNLTVAGVTKPVNLAVQATTNPDGSIRITGSKAFLMTQFGIDPPTAMLGMLKTANRFTVRFDLTASIADSAAAAGPDTSAR